MKRNNTLLIALLCSGSILGATKQHKMKRTAEYRLYKYNKCKRTTPDPLGRLIDRSILWFTWICNCGKRQNCR